MPIKKYKPTTNGRRTAPVVLPEKKEKYKVVSK